MIHALPGMGGDHRMFSGVWLTLPNFVAYDWQPFNGESTLTEVAQSICRAKDIRDGDILVGASLGGMVACEIAKIRKIPQLFLVGSAIDYHEVNRALAALRPLLVITPLRLMKHLAAISSSPLMQMFAGTDIAFLHSMSHAIFQWRGLGVTATKLHRIHGAHDWIIPPPPKVELLLNGGHLISMTHAKECVACVSCNL